MQVQFIPSVLEVCKNSFCHESEGPMASIEMRLVPPKFRLELTAFVNVFGLKFGASLVIEWLTGAKTHFKANFSAEPLDLKVLKILKSRHDTNPGPGGPNCGFDSSKKLLWLSGRIEFLEQSTDCWVKVSPAKFLVNIERMLGPFFFAVRLEGAHAHMLWIHSLCDSNQPVAFAICTAQLGGQGLGSITISAEAGNRADTDIRTKIRDAVHNKIDAWEKAGTKAINEAKAKFSCAQGEVNKAINKLEDARKKLDDKKRDVDKWKNCAGEELLLLQKRYDEGRPERLKRWRVKRASLMAEWRQKKTRELREKLQTYDASVFEQSEPEDAQSLEEALKDVQSEWHQKKNTGAS